MKEIETNVCCLLKPESDFLRRLFDGFDRHVLLYAVMRNYETLPYSHGGSDLDIIVPPHTRHAVLNVINETLLISNAVLLGVSSSPGFLKVYVLGNSKVLCHGWWGLCIDINLGLYFKGLLVMDDKQSWPYEKHNGVRVLPKGFASVLGVLKEVLNNGIIPERYLDNARVAVQKDWDAITKLLSPMGSKALSGVRQAILYNPTDSTAVCNSIRKDFYRHVLVSRPFGYMYGRVKSSASKFLRYIRPSGRVIAFLGTDGAGKSTIINAIKPVLAQATHNTTVVRHLRPNFLPPLAHLKGGNKQMAGPVVNPHGSSASGVFGSLLRGGYATLNYVLGYWFDTRLHIAKQPTVVIFDRYAYDMALDQKRFRISLPPALMHFFVRLAPRPDLVFCLHGTPEIIYSRKKEISFDEVARQTKEIINFAKSNPMAVLVDTTMPVSDSRDKILKAIFDYCNANPNW